MEIKGALTMNKGTQSAERMAHSEEDLRYYLICPLRKGRPRIAVTICHKQKCIWLSSDGGKMKCGYGFQPRGRSSPEGDPNLKLGKRPKVKKIERDGIV